jgi:hypothetical protein
MPHHRIEAALDAWREADRRLAEAEPGSPVEADAQAEVERCHKEYMEAVAVAGQLNADQASAS